MVGENRVFAGSRRALPGACRRVIVPQRGPLARSAASPLPGLSRLRSLMDPFLFGRVGVKKFGFFAIFIDFSRLCWGSFLLKGGW